MEQGEVGLAELFTGRRGPVPADWFSGELRVPQGRVLRPAVPRPLYEKYLILRVERGRVVGQEVKESGEPSGPPGR